MSAVSLVMHRIGKLMRVKSNSPFRIFFPACYTDKKEEENEICVTRDTPTYKDHVRNDASMLAQKLGIAQFEPSVITGMLSPIVVSTIKRQILLFYQSDQICLFLLQTLVLFLASMAANNKLHCCANVSPFEAHVLLLLTEFQWAI